MTAPNLDQLRARANRFLEVLDTCGAGFDRHECLIDFLADAMHWCDFYGEDFHWCLVTACAHYHAERFAEPLSERRLS